MTIPYKKIIYTVLNVAFIAAVAFETKSFSLVAMAVAVVLQNYRIDIMQELIRLHTERRQDDLALVGRLASATKQLCKQVDIQADVIGKVIGRLDQRTPRRGQKG